jgi:hypothetical protein
MVQPPAHAGSSLADFSTLKMEMICSSEMSVYTRSTRRHTSEDGIFHNHPRENLKSYSDNLDLRPNFEVLTPCLEIIFIIAVLSLFYESDLDTNGWTNNGNIFQ